MLLTCGPHIVYHGDPIYILYLYDQMWLVGFILHWNLMHRSIGVAWNVDPYKLIMLQGTSIGHPENSTKIIWPQPSHCRFTRFMITVPWLINAYGFKLSLVKYPVLVSIHLTAD